MWNIRLKMRKTVYYLYFVYREGFFPVFVITGEIHTAVPWVDRPGLPAALETAATGKSTVST